jgi:hypothetical protein
MLYRIGGRIPGPAALRLTMPHLHAFAFSRASHPCAYTPNHNIQRRSQLET